MKGVYKLYCSQSLYLKVFVNVYGDVLLQTSIRVTSFIMISLNLISLHYVNCSSPKNSRLALT